VTFRVALLLKYRSHSTDRLIGERSQKRDIIVIKLILKKTQYDYLENTDDNVLPEEGHF